MNPYLLLNDKPSFYTFFYSQAILNTAWPEMEPTSSTFPKIEINLRRKENSEDLKQTCIISIFMNDELISELKAYKKLAIDEFGIIGWYSRDYLYGFMGDPEVDGAQQHGLSGVWLGDRWIPWTDEMQDRFPLDAIIHDKFHLWLPMVPTEQMIYKVILNIPVAYEKALKVVFDPLSVSNLSMEVQAFFSDLSIYFGIYRLAPYFVIGGWQEMFSNIDKLIDAAAQIWMSRLREVIEKTRLRHMDYELHSGQYIPYGEAKYEMRKVYISQGEPKPSRSILNHIEQNVGEWLKLYIPKYKALLEKRIKDRTGIDVSKQH